MAKIRFKWRICYSNFKKSRYRRSFIVDKISSLTISKSYINADSTITLTGNSYISSLTNADSNRSNIIKGSYTLADNSGNEYTACGTSSISTSNPTFDTTLDS